MQTLVCVYLHFTVASVVLIQLCFTKSVLNKELKGNRLMVFKHTSSIK